MLGRFEAKNQEAKFARNGAMHLAFNQQDEDRVERNLPQGTWREDDRMVAVLGDRWMRRNAANKGVLMGYHKRDERSWRLRLATINGNVKGMSPNAKSWPSGTASAGPQVRQLLRKYDGRQRRTRAKEALRCKLAKNRGKTDWKQKHARLQWAIPCSQRITHNLN